MAHVTPEDALTLFAEMQAAYRLTFGTDAGKLVLEDFGRFCRARETCAVPGDSDRTFVLEGRREVFLRVQDFLERPPQDLVAIYTRVDENVRTEDD